MNLKALSFNYMSIAVLAGSVTALAAGVATFANQPQSLTPVFAPAPVHFAVQSLQITGDNTGTAVIALNDMIINVGFDFTAYPDSNGTLGHSSTAIDIEGLSIYQVKSLVGDELADFTTADDHRNINLLIATYIEKNRLVEAV